MIEKRENETTYEHGLRIIQSKCNNEIDLDWDEIVELLNLDCHKDSLRKAANVTPYSGVAVAKYYQDKIENMIVENSDNVKSLLEEIKLEKKELYKERVKLQDERRYRRSDERSEARSEMLIDEMVYAISKLNEEKPMNFKLPNLDESKSNIASLILSDLHIGMTIDSFDNKFNFDIARERFNLLYQKVAETCLLHNVKTLNVEVCGDLIHGAIHTSSRLLQEADVTTQITICSELISEFLVALASEIQNVNVFFCVGNHSRMSADMKKHIDAENFEYLIKQIVTLRVEKCENITFHDNELDKEIAVYEVFGRVVAAAHGHKEKKTFQSVDVLSKYLGIKIDEIHLGHFHNFAIQNDVIVNSSFCGVDQYAKSLRLTGKASQTLIIYNDRYDRCIYDINLQH